MTSFTLIPGQLSHAQIEASLAAPLHCYLSEAAIPLIQQAQQTVQTIVDEQRTVYGINTGFGSLASQRISNSDLAQLQRNIVLSHACGTGEYLSDELSGLMLLLKINALAQGYSGIRLEVIEALLALYNHRVYPCIPAKGSVGASGDLIPLAHLALPLLGEGDVRYQGKIIPAAEGLALAGLSVMNLGPKEGLALLNGLQASLAMALVAYYQTKRLFNIALLSGAMSVEASSGSHTPFDARIHQIRANQAQADVAAFFCGLLEGSAIREAHTDCGRVQDPYSLRCQPQVMGACLHQMRFVGDTLANEINAVTDNPLVFSAQDSILSGGNFHGELIAMAADNLALAIAEMGAISERRIALLIDKNFSQLPAFLVNNSGLNSGFMIAHVNAASCASDNKALAHPHSVDSLPTSANQEDHVSMATNAARRLFEMLDNTATILSIELLAACQGIDFHAPIKTSPFLTTIYEQVRKRVAFYDQDRYFAPDIKEVKTLVLSGELLNDSRNLH